MEDSMCSVLSPAYVLELKTLLALQTTLFKELLQVRVLAEPMIKSLIFRIILEGSHAFVT